MIVNFTKMQSLGNDFVVIDAITQGPRLHKNLVQRIASRNFGIGCDQIILVKPPTKPGVDFFYQVFNADGHEVEQCGNGLRCAARLFVDNGLTNKTQFTAECLGGTSQVNVESADYVRINLGKNYTAVHTQQVNYPNIPATIHTIAVGNPHGIFVVDDVSTVPVAEWGKIVGKDPLFPHGANIGFMQVIARDRIRLRVYERGVGVSLACGSNACAAVLVGKSLGLLDHRVNVEFEFGELLIAIDQQDHTLHMSGSATSVFLGRFKI